MPDFKWNELDFLEFFPVAPILEDYYAASYNYEAERNGLRLLFTVWEMESVIQASLFRLSSEKALSTWAAYVRGEVRLIDDDRGRYLEFEDCIVAPNRFWYLEAGDVFDKTRFPFSVTITVTIDPDFHIAFVNYESRT